VSTKETEVQLDRRQLLLTTAGAATLLLASRAIGIEPGAGANVGRSQLFDFGWRFHRGAGEGFELRDFDDSAWRSVDLPHDWSIEDLPPGPAGAKAGIVGPFDRTSEGGTATGFSVGGEGRYRKTFRLQTEGKGRVEVLFEGVYMDSDVWLNGQHLGFHSNGYTPFAYDLTPHLSPGGDNVLAVRVRNLGRNSRWYSGSGIYRHVWLDVLPEQARITRWGVGVVTRRLDEESADLEINTRLEDVGNGLVLVSRVRDESGRVVKEIVAPAAAEIAQTMTLAKVHRWSPEKPALYTLETELRRGDRIIDRARNAFGIRIVAFTTSSGMTINGTPTKLRGGCIHHDNGLLGAAAFDVAEERKALLLKARGFNAVRPSHNPFSAAFLQACDRHGLLVVGETFDAWHEPKLPQDYSVRFDEHWRDDLTTIVRASRNHPSIIMWSIGNEIPGRNSPAGVELQWRLANEVRRLDPTRPVTAAINGFVGRAVTPSEKTARPGFAGVPDQTSVIFLDVVGYNYKLSDYVADHGQFPFRIILGTESFAKDVADIWALTEKTPWLIGDFVWTAMDYLGEAGIGGSVVVEASAAANPLATMAGWPWTNASCGDIDLIGQQKAPSLARDVIWGVSPLEVAVRRPVPDGRVEVVRIWGWHDEQRSWTWPGAKGKNLTVCAYTVGDRVELRLNGRTVDTKSVTAANRNCVEFSVSYEPGELEAVAFLNGAELARKQLRTVGTAFAIRVTPERSKGSAARADVSYVGIEIVDAEGRVVPDAEHVIQIELSGPGELIGFGSANPLAVGSFQSNTTRSWDGRALAIVRGRDRAGRVKIAARAEGLRSGSALLSLI
jgi:beta-galactosidase